MDGEKKEGKRDEEHDRKIAILVCMLAFCNGKFQSLVLRFHMFAVGDHKLIN